MTAIISPGSSTFLAQNFSSSLWHYRLGHANSTIVNKVLSNFHVSSSYSNKKSSLCEACMKAKSHRLPLYTTNSVSKTPFDIVFSDVWTSSIQSIEGYKYLVSFIDDHSRFVWPFPLFQKPDVYSVFLKFHAFVKTQFQCQIKALHSNWGGEYRSLSDKFKQLGIHHRALAPYTPQQRKNRHLTEMSLALLAHSGVPLKYWVHAFLIVAHIINFLPTPIKKFLSPYQQLFHKVLYYKFLNVLLVAPTILY